MMVLPSPQKEKKNLSFSASFRLVRKSLPVDSLAFDKATLLYPGLIDAPIDF
jgi:hypothetical protein